MRDEKRARQSGRKVTTHGRPSRALSMMLKTAGKRSITTQHDPSGKSTLCWPPAIMKKKKKNKERGGTNGGDEERPLDEVEPGALEASDRASDGASQGGVEEEGDDREGEEEEEDGPEGDEHGGPAGVGQDVELL